MLQPVEDRLLERRRDAHRAHALDIGVAANRLQPRPGPAHHSPHQGESRDRLHGGRAVKVVGHPHRPGEHDPRTGGVLLSHAVDLPPRHARLRHDLVPGEGVEPRGELRPAGAVLPQKRLIDDRLGPGATPDRGGGIASGRPLRLQFPQPLHQTVDERQVTADVGLHVGARDLGPEEERPRIARHGKVDEPRLDDRVDDDHLSATTADHHQRPHQPRVVARRVTADQKHAVGLFHVVELHRAGAGADHARQPHATGLVAVVTAVVDVVGAVEPGEELQQETRFIARPAAEVEKRLRGRCGLQRGGDPLERVGPGDWPVMLRALLEDHRLHEPAGMLQLVRRKRPQLRQ